MTPEVDDFALYRYFTQRYGTVRCAKVHLGKLFSVIGLDTNPLFRLCLMSPDSAKDMDLLDLAMSRSSSTPWAA